MGRLQNADAMALVSDPRSPAYIESEESRNYIIDYCAGGMIEFIFLASVRLKTMGLSSTVTYLLSLFTTSCLTCSRLHSSMGVRSVTAGDINLLEDGEVSWDFSNSPYNSELLVHRDTPILGFASTVVEPVSHLALRGMRLARARSRRKFRYVFHLKIAH